MNYIVNANEIVRIYLLSRIIGIKSDPPFIMSPCMCYGLIVVMETGSTQNFKYNQNYLLL